MITRAQMQRQLRNRGGIMTVKTIRKKYGLGSDLKDFVRKIIPNEIADVAVKAAPFVAPFYPGTAALMRGIGRFDQRGSISDALKQGAATFAFGKGVGKLGGAEGSELGNVFGGQKYSMEGFKTQGLGKLFQGGEKAKNLDDTRKGVDIIQRGTDATIGKVPVLRELPDIVKQQLFVGGITSGATALYEYFKGGFRPQEEGETIEEYLAERKKSVGTQMRTYMDNYFKFDKEYSTMTDAERDAFVERYNVRDGGRIGYQTGGITMTNTLAQNKAINNARRAQNQAILQGARNKIFKSGTDISRLIGPGTGIKEPSYGGQQTYSNLGFAALQPATTSNQTTTPTTVSQTSTAPDLTKQSEAFGKMIEQKFEEAYGNPEDYRVEAATLNMPLPVYMDYLLTSDPKNISYQYRKQDPYYDPQFDTPRDPNEIEELSPLNMYYQRELQRQIDAGIPELERIKFGEVMAPPTMLPSSGTMPSLYESYADALARTRADMGLALGGRVGYALGGNELPPDPTTPVNPFKPKPIGPVLPNKEMASDEISIEKIEMLIKRGADNDLIKEFTGASDGVINQIRDVMKRKKQAGGGVMSIPVRTNSQGIKELDMRKTGGFVPIGVKEKADDVPAMLSKNEFVMTADAVRAAGGGSIQKGAQKMYDTMKKLESRVA
jgi:hypothetical protein